MNKKHIAIPSIIFFLAFCIIIFLIPTEIKNPIVFYIILIITLLYNMISLFLIIKSTTSKLSDDIYNIPLIYVFIGVNFILCVLLLISKVIYVSISILMILLVAILALYSLLVYYLVISKNYIINKNETIKNNTKYQRIWQTKVEILVNNNKDKELSDLFEKIKYMDPKQSKETDEIDEKIDSIFRKIDNDISSAQIAELNQLIDSRNIILKNNK